MAGKKVIWSTRANIELENILDYYNKRNGSVVYSLKLLDEIDDIIETLSISEFIGRLTANKITRVVVMKAYLIFYEVGNNTINILSFWDNRQDEKSRIEI